MPLVQDRFRRDLPVCKYNQCNNEYKPLNAMNLEKFQHK